MFVGPLSCLNKPLLVRWFFCEAPNPSATFCIYFFSGCLRRCLFFFCIFIATISKKASAENNSLNLRVTVILLKEKRSLHKEDLNLCQYPLWARWDYKALPYTLSYLGSLLLRDKKRLPLHKPREVKWFVQGHTAIT